MREDSAPVDGLEEVLGEALFITSLIDLPFSFLLDTLTLPYTGISSMVTEEEPTKPESTNVRTEGMGR